MHKDEIAYRLTRLRARLKAESLGGFIVPHDDEFQNEYLPADAERLAYITGFTGSAGMAIVLMDRAALFVDGRYTLQAPTQVNTALFEVAHLTNNPPTEWLARNLTAGMHLGYDPWLHAPAQIETLEEVAAKANARMVAVQHNPLDAIWDHRPKPPAEPVHLHPLEFAGESSEKKRTLLAEKLREDKIDAVIITDPASIAWLLNVRGNDIPHTPVVLSHAILYADGQVDWFVDPTKRGNLHIDGVRVYGCSEFSPKLGEMMGKRVSVDQNTVSGVFERLRAGGAEIVRGQNPCLLPKACKNQTELDGARAAHLRDGAALSNFLAWFAAADQTRLTEIDIANRVEEFRAVSNHYRGPSFDTIAASGPNGANAHYHADEASNRTLDPNNLLLLDSGAQYQDGTTDITRTIPIGMAAANMREMFTLVLKGHIALARARFPAGTTGTQLDVLARQFLWQRGVNYDHGTGHAVGSYLSVHDGPGRIFTTRGDGAVLHPGMIVSNEPGYYEAGAYGIRIENLVTVKKGADGYLELETISLAPIDRALIVAEMLTGEERAWLNDYHARVERELQPLVDAATAAWLKRACAKL